MDKELKEKIKNLPQSPGIYFFKNSSGLILYIGKAINIQKRVKSHFFKSADNFRQKLLNETFEMDFIGTENENQAIILESRMIKKYLPKFNIQWRDDKSFPFVVFTPTPKFRLGETKELLFPNPKKSLTQKSKELARGQAPEEWPRVIIAHQHNLKKLKNKGCDFPLPPVGPFLDSVELKSILRALRKILPYKTCKNKYEKPCLQWHLNLCPAHEPPYSSPPQMRGRLRGGGDINKFKLTPPPPTPSPTGEGRNMQINYLHSLNTLSQLLRLYVGEPVRIEAYDISNIQGDWATGSMVVFEGMKAKKSDYRKFRIKTVRGANDTAMIKEVLRRRLNHPEWPRPDLILIDGGKGQLNAASSVAKNLGQMANGKSFQSHKLLAISPMLPAIISLAKREEEIYTEFSKRGLKIKELPIPLRLTLQAIRNEAHRFAIAYYRKLHGRTIG